MSVTLAIGAHLMLLGLVHGHAKKKAAGVLTDRQIWDETRWWALVLFVVLTVLSSIDVFLTWRSSP